ncbi:hypothetical protein Tsubulata_039839, partial [Turnera subulata]
MMGKPTLLDVMKVVSEYCQNMTAPQFIGLIAITNVPNFYTGEKALKFLEEELQRKRMNSSPTGRMNS